MKLTRNNYKTVKEQKKLEKPNMLLSFLEQESSFY